MFLLAILVGGLVVAEKPGVRVTYVANEGFLVESASHKILIDALFDDPTISYAHVPRGELLEKLRGARPPFDDVDLILVTHAHRDHFSAESVLRHLAANPEAVFAGPLPAVEALRAHERWAETLADRLHPIDLEPFQRREIEAAGVPVVAHRIRHSAYMETDPDTGEQRNRHEKVVNIAYRFELDGFVLLHTGDAFLDDNASHLREHIESGEIDLLFFEGWNPPSLDLIRDHLAPRFVLAMHLPPDEEQVARIAEYLGRVLPHAEVLPQPLASRVFPSR